MEHGWPGPASTAEARGWGGDGGGEDRAGETSPHIHSLVGDALGARIPREGAS